MDTTKHIVGNFSPLRWSTLKDDTIGTLEFVIPEVLVSQVVQRMLGRKRESIMRTIAAHTLSIPFIGGLGVFGAKNHAKADDNYTAQLASGLNGVPGMWLGYYLTGNFAGENLIRWADWTIRDFILTILTKTVTRSIVTTPISYLARDNPIKASYDTMQKTQVQQENHILCNKGKMEYSLSTSYQIHNFHRLLQSGFGRLHLQTSKSIIRA